MLRYLRRMLFIIKMKKLLFILVVLFSNVIFSQDTNYVSVFYSTKTSQHDLISFNLNDVFSLEKFSQILSIRYGYDVICEEFVNSNGFVDIFLSIAPHNLENLDCRIFTSLSVVEKFYKNHCLDENIEKFIIDCENTNFN